MCLQHTVLSVKLCKWHIFGCKEELMVNSDSIKQMIMQKSALHIELNFPMTQEKEVKVRKEKLKFSWEKGNISPLFWSVIFAAQYCEAFGIDQRGANPILGKRPWLSQHGAWYWWQQLKIFHFGKAENMMHVHFKWTLRSSIGTSSHWPAFQPAPSTETFGKMYVKLI